MRSDHGQACWRGKLYVVGGQKYDTEIPMRSVKVLDLADVDMGWTAVPSLTIARKFLAAVCWDGRLYALGGMDNGGEYIASIGP